MAATVTYEGKYKVRKITVAWTSDGSGDATGAVKIDGAIVRVVTNPGAAAPTANYDVTLIGPDGEDLAAGELADRHTSTTEQVFLTDTPFHYSATEDVTVTIANAGDTKTGTVVLYTAYGM